jgi:hypothetical protein
MEEESDMLREPDQTRDPAILATINTGYSRTIQLRESTGYSTNIDT